MVRGGGLWWPWWWGGGGGGGGRGAAGAQPYIGRARNSRTRLRVTGFGPKPDTKHPNPQNLKGFGFRFSLGFRLGVLGFGFRVLKIRVV